MSLTARTTTGILWNLSEQFARRGVSVVVTLLLAKFLVPEDFGLVAMMAVFLAMGQSLMDSGFREALIRLQEASQEDYSTAFYANLALGLTSYCVLFVAAPPIAQFYDEPRLVELIRVASLSVIVMSFQVVQVARLSRELDFKAQLKASFPASLISGVVAVWLAWLDFGVWALIAQMLINGFVHTALLWLSEGWRPSLEFSMPALKKMYGFGYKLFLSGTLDTVFRNLYVIVIAKVFSAPIAGLYFFAQKLKELVVQQIVSSIQKVTYPALASVQNDDARLKEGYKKIVVLMSLLLFPGILFAALLAEPLFELLLPEKWLPAVPYFQLLCVASVLMPLHSVNLNILKVKGRSDLYLYLEVVKKSINAATLFVTYRYGVHAIILGQVLTSIVNYLPNSYFSSKLLGYGLSEQIKDFMPALIISILCSILGFLIMEYFNLSPALSIIIVSPAYLFAFVGLNLVFNKRSFRSASQYFRNQILRRRPQA